MEKSSLYSKIASKFKDITEFSPKNSWNSLTPLNKLIVKVSGALFALFMFCFFLDKKLNGSSETPLQQKISSAPINQTTTKTTNTGTINLIQKPMETTKQQQTPPISSQQLKLQAEISIASLGPKTKEKIKTFIADLQILRSMRLKIGLQEISQITQLLNKTSHSDSENEYFHLCGRLGSAYNVITESVNKIDEHKQFNSIIVKLLGIDSYNENIFRLGVIRCKGWPSDYGQFLENIETIIENAAISNLVPTLPSNDENFLTHVKNKIEQLVPKQPIQASVIDFIKECYCFGEKFYKYFNEQLHASEELQKEIFKKHFVSIQTICAIGDLIDDIEIENEYCWTEEQIMSCKDDLELLKSIASSQKWVVKNDKDHTDFFIQNIKNYLIGLKQKKMLGTAEKNFIEACYDFHKKYFYRYQALREPSKILLFNEDFHFITIFAIAELHKGN
ncbi:MAG: hypothetical protein H0W88_00425 [Parachlamydiaceae bacterium]|nr:hypothetical protein [Parachlamydiaceae bacterium]